MEHSREGPGKSQPIKEVFPGGSWTILVRRTGGRASRGGAGQAPMAVRGASPLRCPGSCSSGHGLVRLAVTRRHTLSECGSAGVPSWGLLCKDVLRRRWWMARVQANRDEERTPAQRPQRRRQQATCTPSCISRRTTTPARRVFLGRPRRQVVSRAGARPATHVQPLGGRRRGPRATVALRPGYVAGSSGKAGRRPWPASSCPGGTRCRCRATACR